MSTCTKGFTRPDAFDYLNASSDCRTIMEGSCTDVHISDCAWKYGYDVESLGIYR